MFNNIKSDKEAKLQINIRKSLKLFLLIFLPSLLLVTGIAAYIYYSEVKDAKNRRHILENKEADNVDQQFQIIVDNFNMIVSDLAILCGHYEMQKMLEVGGASRRNILAQEFLTCCDARGNYDQIRFLDETGMEIIRINFNDGVPYIVPEDQLQSKEGRYYFTDTFRLNKGEVYASPFDLNIEKGVIEIPVKPVIRFGTPVVDINDQKRGIVIINYLGHKLIDRLKSASIGALGSVMLLNAEGYWLHGIRPEDEFGFMYEDRNNMTFTNAYPDAWQEMSVNESGQFSNANGLFTFATVYPLMQDWKTTTGSGKAFEKSKAQLEAEGYKWKIVSHVMPDDLDTLYHKFLSYFYPVYGAFIMIIGFISWILANASVNKTMNQEKVTSSLEEIKIANERLKCEYEERVLVVKALQESEEKFRAISATANDAIIMLDNDERISYWNEAAVKIFGYLKKETEGKNIHNLMIPERYRKKHLNGFEKFKATGAGKIIGKTVEVAAIRKDGAEIPIELSLSAVKRNGKWNAIGMIRDITTRKQQEEKIRLLAEADSLTNIYNRRMLLHFLEAEINKAKRYSKEFSLIMLDIDHFKTVNDTYGHDVGDYVLKATVNVIKRNIRKADIFARYGGEEFMIVQPETTIERAKVYAEKIRTIIEQNNFDKVKKITISIGVTMFNKNDTIESITKRVDDALYRAKDNGRNRVEAA